MYGRSSDTCMFTGTKSRQFRMLFPNKSQLLVMTFCLDVHYVSIISNLMCIFICKTVVIRTKSYPTLACFWTVLFGQKTLIAWMSFSSKKQIFSSIPRHKKKKNKQRCETGSRDTSQPWNVWNEVIDRRKFKKDYSAKSIIYNSLYIIKSSYISDCFNTEVC